MMMCMFVPLLIFNIVYTRNKAHISGSSLLSLMCYNLVRLYNCHCFTELLRCISSLGTSVWTCGGDFLIQICAYNKQREQVSLLSWLNSCIYAAIPALFNMST